MSLFPTEAFNVVEGLHGHDAKQRVSPFLSGFEAARTACLSSQEMRAGVATLKERFSRTRTHELHYPYCDAPFWLTRMSSLRGFQPAPMFVNVGSECYALGFHGPTFEHFVRIADREGGAVRVVGVPLGGVGSRYSKLTPQWSLGLTPQEHPSFRKCWGLKLSLEFLAQESLYGLFSRLFSFWNLDNRIRVSRTEGKSDGYTIAPVNEKDWRLHAWSTYDGSPMSLDVFHWSDIQTPAQMLRDAVREYFVDVKYCALSVFSEIKTFESHRARLNADTTSWVTSPNPGYQKDFDPFTRPDWATDDDPVRCPVLFWYDHTPEQDTVPVLQVDVIHTSRGSFLELQSIRGRKKMNEFIKVAGVPFEFWEGPPHLRWDGTGTAVGV